MTLREQQQAADKSKVLHCQTGSSPGELRVPQRPAESDRAGKVDPGNVPIWNVSNAMLVITFYRWSVNQATLRMIADKP